MTAIEERRPWSPPAALEPIERPQWTEYAEAELVDEDRAEARALGVMAPRDRSTRRHAMRAPGFAYALEREDVAQPLRTYVDPLARTRAANALLGMRVALAGVATLCGLAALLVVLGVLAHAVGWAW